MNVFAAHNPDPEIRRQSSSGGVFSLLAENILRNGGVVYGAAFADDWTVVHRRVDNEEGLATLRGSKYVYSNVGSAYSDVMTDLECGRQVLFSGTPCQVAAMKQRAGDNPMLLLVEIVCHGAPRPEYWKRYLAELCQQQDKTIADITSVNFRDKRTGWKNYSFTICFRDGTIFTQSHDDNLYMRAFLQNFTLREACFRCPFKQPEGSRANITLGDLWGISQLAPEIDNDLGTTLVIISFDNLSGLMDASARCRLEFNDVIRYNPAITTPARKPTKWEAFEGEIGLSKLISTFNKFAGRSIYLNFKLRIYRLVKTIHIW